MQDARVAKLKRLLSLLGACLIVKVAATVVWGYRGYFPPNFDTDFLRGREPYFFGVYSWAFFAHIIVGPISLVLGLVLVSERFRMRFPAAHRLLGKCQIAIVLFLIAPSGLWMAYYAETGAVAATGFGVLALATGACALLGWRTAVANKFAEHRRWMWRCYLLLCSAVLLRLMGGLAEMMHIEGSWAYQFASWVSWVAPLAVFELTRAIKLWMRSPVDRPGDHSASSTASSLPAMEMSA